jgi:hypothetical protein
MDEISDYVIRSTVCFIDNSGLIAILFCSEFLMATLVRPKIAQHIQDPSLSLLQTSIPTPFPSNEERLQEEILEELAKEKVDFEINVEPPTGSSRLAESSKRLQSSSYNGLVSD